MTFGMRKREKFYSQVALRQPQRKYREQICLDLRNRPIANNQLISRRLKSY
jgi:hypothetical protein